MAERAPPADALGRAGLGGRSDADLLADLLDGGVWVVLPAPAEGAPGVATLLQPGGDALTVLIGIERSDAGGRRAVAVDDALHAAHARELAATRAAIRRAGRRVRRLAWLPRLALLPVLGGLLGGGAWGELARLGVPAAVPALLARTAGWEIVAAGAGLGAVVLAPQLLAQVRLRRRRRARHRRAEADWLADHGLARGTGADTLGQSRR